MSARDEAIRAHGRCISCISEDRGVLQREGCSLEIPRDQALGIDCDTCQAFSDQRSKKPDFVILYERQINISSVQPRWLIVEMERQIRDAREVLDQVSAGAAIVRTDKQFQFAGTPSLVEGLILHSGSCHVAQADVIRQRGAKAGAVRIPVRLHKAAGPGVRLVEDGQGLRLRPKQN